MDQALSHDLLTPVNHILGYTEMLQEEAEAMGLPPFIEQTAKLLQIGKSILGLIQAVRPEEAGAYSEIKLQALKTGLPGLVQSLRQTCSALRDVGGTALDPAFIKDIGRIELASIRLQELNDQRVGNLLTEASS